MKCFSSTRILLRVQKSSGHRTIEMLKVLERWSRAQALRAVKARESHVCPQERPRGLILKMTIS